MDETDHPQRVEELQQKVNGAKESAYRSELDRIDRDIESKTQDLIAAFRAREEAAKAEKIIEIDARRAKAAEEFASRAEAFRGRLESEQRTKQERLARAREERRIRLEEEQRRKEEEERRRREEEERKRVEEEARARAEEERKRQEEELRRQDEERRRKEEERLRREEELRKKEEEERRRLQEEIRRKESEHRRQEEERKERIISLIASAEVLYANKEYESALVEVAKALVNDPTNPAARALEQRIKEAQGIPLEPVEGIPQEEEPPVVVESVPEEPKTINRISPAGAIKEKTSTRGKMWAVAALVVVAVVIVVIWQFHKGLFPQRFRLAMLPLTSPTNDIEDARLGTALSMDIIERLEEFTPVEIMAATSTIHLRTLTDFPERHAFSYGYLYALTGSVKRDATGYEIKVTLVDSLGASAWSQNYNVAQSALSSFPSTLTRDLLLTMEIDQSRIDEVLHSRSHTPKELAYTYYLNGLAESGASNALGTENAYTTFLQAAQEDPTYADAPAHAALALVHLIGTRTNVADSTVANVARLANASLALDPTNPQAHLALAHIRLLQKQYEMSLQQIDTVLDQAPNNAAAQLLKSRIHIEKGDYDRALESALKAYARDPSDMDVLTILTSLHLLLGTPAEGFGYLESGVVIAPDSTDYLSGPYANAIMFDPELLLSRLNRVRLACERRLAADPQDYATTYRLARMMQVSGSAQGASDLLEKNVKLIQAALKTDAGEPRKTMILALTLTRLGRYAEASTLAKRMVEQVGSPYVLYKAAQVNALQLYSQKNREIDPHRLEETLKYLRTAVQAKFVLDEIIDADFFNLFDKPEFRTAIRVVTE